MQICKSKKAVLASFFLMWSSLAFSIFAQSLDMPEMPEMPSMPTIGGGFYTPSFPTRVKNNTQNQNTTENGKEKNETVLTESITPEVTETIAPEVTESVISDDYITTYWGLPGVL